ncbi:hypothetical protein [Megalodesulfovibrio gigas]|uniref:hypothetical protein n=1 Tax=Megalodesulfovibrio gigas TaxID=879 RepID=UPI000487617B|nr:hypothetical protein [Megalodesulfovibrio gigas]
MSEKLSPKDKIIKLIQDAGTEEGERPQEDGAEENQQNGDTNSNGHSIVVHAGSGATVQIAARDIVNNHIFIIDVPLS